MAISLSLMAMFSAGCATVATGKYQDVPITSEPIGAKVRSDTGEFITAPGRMLLLRNRAHTLVAEYPGCEPQQIQLKNKVQGWFWGNILLGGIVGGVVDIASGACDELVPKKVHFDFTGAGQAVAQQKSSYLQSHPDITEDVRFAILAGVAANGMTKEELIASLGEPNRIDESGKYEKLIYNNRTPQYYYFKNGVLEKAE